MPRIFKLEGKVQHYAWGGLDYIPQLLKQQNAARKPFAEYWLGAHSSQPGTVLRGTAPEALTDLLANEGADVLGQTVARQFGTLPYLLKVLDVRQMLSIQVHPSKGEAEKGFLREEAAGIPVTAPHRNYKDANHKPELMVALSPFWLLHGFKPAASLRSVLENTPELKPLLPLFEQEGYKALYEKLMTMPEEEVNSYLAPLAKRVLPLYEAGTLSKTAEDFWAARAITSFCKNGQYDRGIFSIYCFNLLHLQAGEGIFQPAGMPHAYLEGQNVEIMANSDNVLRAGLTDKHIDVPELLKHTTFAATLPNVLPPAGRETFYPAPVPEFGLYQYQLEAGSTLTLQTSSAEVWLVLEGDMELAADGASLPLEQGEAALVYANSTLALKSAAGGRFFRAAVGSV